MRRGLVGHHVRRDAARNELGINRGRVSAKRDGRRPLFSSPPRDTRESIVQRRRRILEIPRTQPLLDPRRIHFHHEGRGTRHPSSQRLRTTHAAEASSEHETPCKIRLPKLLGDPRENLVGALDDPLRPDVLPAARREPTPADEPAALEVVEHLFARPATHEVAVRHDHQRRLRVRAHQRNRTARLHDERLPLFHGFQGGRRSRRGTSSRARLCRAPRRQRDSWGLRRL